MDDPVARFSLRHDRSAFRDGERSDTMLSAVRHCTQSAAGDVTGLRDRVMWKDPSMFQARGASNEDVDIRRFQAVLVSIITTCNSPRSVVGSR